MTEHLPPAGLTVRGTVLVVPGRGETPATYARFGRRLAADAYVVRILPTVPVTAGDLPTARTTLDAALTAAVTTTAVTATAVTATAVTATAVTATAVTATADPAQLFADPVRPLVVVGADTGAALLAALLSAPAENRAWSPDAVVLAGLPGYDRHHRGGWDTELDARSHCPVHRGVLTDDPAVARGALADPVPAELLDAAYGSASPVPHLLLSGEADPIADRDALTRLAKSLPAARLSTVRTAHHDVLNDTSHRSVAAEVVSFLESVRDGLPVRPFVHTESSTW